MTTAAQRRGFDINEFPDSFRLAMAHADADRVSQALVEVLGTERVVETERAIADEDGISVYQFDGQSWAGLIPLTLPYERVLSDETLAELSNRLGAEVVCFEHEDTSGWSIFRLYQSGEVVEEFQWGVDYDEEFAEQMAAAGMDIEALDAEWDVSVKGGDELAPDKLQFKSSRRTVEEAEVMDPFAFLDQTYCDLDAWQPSWDALYAAGEDELRRADLVEPPV